MMRQAWGKTEGDEVHHLAHHCMDVAAVFAALLELPVFRDRLETAAEASLTEADCQRLSALVFLHDIGKLHPGFQAKGWPPGSWRGPTAGHLKEGLAFLLLAVPRPEHPFHGTTREIMKWGEAIGSLFRAVIAHHGRPVETPSAPMLADWRVVPHYDWRAEAAVMCEALHRWFAAAFESDGRPLPCNPRFHHAVAGLAALADWIGSDTRFFPFSQPFDLSHDTAAHDAAREAVATIGLDPGPVATIPAPSFSGLTGFLEPNPAQAVVGDVGPEARLLILEAETGSGKTEAALWRFTQLLAAGSVSGLYFAVPTRAAARQLHRRVKEAMCRVFGEGAPEAVLAIPGMLRSGDFEGQRLPHWQVKWEDDSISPARRWAAEHATRFLAAPVAVGTVDQAMLAGLQVKHAHLRGSALDRSLLVIDEVHASDAYMTEVLAKLLDGHLDTGGYAMLMSATLGSRARVRWTGESPPGLGTARTTPYPAVWVQGESGPRAAADAGRTKAVHAETVPTMDPEETGRLAVTAAERGARVLVIRNTVDKAVETWRAVRASGGGSLVMQAAGSPALHHARFAVEDRALLDQTVEEALAPSKDREPRGCIVIGTQTLEQSLDIDADLLITDLCPVDVLLQRIGRLHRHEIRTRPADFETARALVMLPEGGLDRLADPPGFENGLGGWKEDGGFNGIYTDLAALELTRRLILQNPVWRIPEMNRLLVEGATHPDCINALLAEKGGAWEQYDREHGGARMAEAMVAKLCALDRGVLFDDQLGFPASDERIMTRLGEEGAILDFDPPPEGPFGQRVTRIALPAQWSKGLTGEDQVGVTLDDPGLVLSVADQLFRYSVEGLERAS